MAEGYCCVCGLQSVYDGKSMMRRYGASDDTTPRRPGLDEGGGGGRLERKVKWVMNKERRKEEKITIRHALGTRTQTPPHQTLWASMIT